jgi:hypothetical protein
MPRDANTQRPKVIRPPAVVFREAIEQAEADGVKKAKMTLRLTLRDDSDLKRDRTLAVTDISFKEGEMRFLGVKVEPGGVVVSVLDRG